MTGEKNTTPHGGLRRRQAEDLLREKAAGTVKSGEVLSPEEARQLVHELRVHQIELEMQNEELRRAQEELEASRARYFDLYDLAPVGYFTLSDKGLILEANLTAATMLGASRSTLVKHPLTSFILPEDKDIYYRRLKLLFETGAPQVYELRMLRQDGMSLWVRIVAIVARDSVEASLCRATISDITDRKRADKALQESEERFKNLYQESPIPTFTWQRKGDDFILIDFNRAAIQVTNRKACDHLGNSAVELYKNGPQILSDMNLCFQERSVVRREITSRHFAPGCHLSVNYAFIPPDLIIVQTEDQTDRKRMEEALQDSEKRYRELSILDDLTQLYNSRYFYHQLKIEVDRLTRYEEQPLTLLLLDLDNFKHFNDTYGHVEGDQVLLRLGQVVKRCLRQTDSAYRYGGEEFTILLPMTTSKDAAVTAERIKTGFKKEIFSPTPGKDVHVTVSIGLGQYNLGEEMKTFVHRVDQLMYQAKKKGKDRVCSDS